MKKVFFMTGLALASLTFTGCSSLNELGVKLPALEFKLDKQAGVKYYVSVQKVQKHEAPCASSKVVGSLKMGDTVIVKAIIPLKGHLATDKADSWLEIAEGNSVYYIPGNTVIGQELWEAQLNGLPPRGGVKVKNFTSARHQDADADLDQAELTNRALRLILSANGSVKSEDGKAYPVELGNYISQQTPGTKVDIKLPVSKRSLIDFPSVASFVEIGPYQEFDMGAGLAAAMMKNALNPTHPVTLYVKKIVDRLLKNSNLPYAYGGYHVIVLKDDATVNACAAPGGFVFVTTGMLKYLRSEDELALILAHEIGHIEFHHSVRSLGCADYAAFAAAALISAIDLNDPAVKKAITDSAMNTVKAIPLFDSLSEEVQKQRIQDAVDKTTAGVQLAIDNAFKTISKVLASAGEHLSKGHTVEFESAADRRAVSLAAAAGYNTEALSQVLARIKKDHNGFGEAYPVNRDELVTTFRANYPVSVKSPVGDYKAIRGMVDKLSPNDLFIKK